MAGRTQERPGFHCIPSGLRPLLFPGMAGVIL